MSRTTTGTTCDGSAQDANDVTQILTERGLRYGSFQTNASISQSLKQAMRAAPGWALLSDAQKEGLEMVQHKIARMLNGDPFYLDNIVDILGYSTLVREAMEFDNAQMEKPERN